MTTAAKDELETIGTPRGTARTALLTTVAVNGRRVSRPTAVQERELDGDLRVGHPQVGESRTAELGQGA